MKGYEIFRACDRHSTETVTIIKYVAEYEQIGKRMVEFLSKFHDRDIKIVKVNSIHVAKPPVFFNILRTCRCSL